MISETALEALQSTQFTHDLASRHLEKLASMATEVTFSEGDTIFREGDLTEVVYLILDGRVAVEIRVPGRGQVSILTVDPGGLLGCSSVFPGKRKTAGARAVVRTRAIAINATQLWEACQADHDLGYAMMWRVAEVIAGRLDATRLQLLDMFGSSGAE